MQQATTHFGFRDVAEDEKAPLVRGVFNRVAPRYDIMNDAMSFGLHRYWKNALIDALKPVSGMTLLDLAGGTGDIALRALACAPDMRVTLADINAEMLSEGRNRAIDRNVLSGIEWVCGNAEALPFPSHHFDACTIAFGIRNVTHIDRALTEIHRVLKPGGHFLCLEFSVIRQEALARIYDWYSFHVIPRMGKAIAGDDAPYRYLVESIRRFPGPERFADMMRRAGFARVSQRPLSGGAVAIHSGWKL